MEVHGSGPKPGMPRLRAVFAAGVEPLVEASDDQSHEF